MPVRLELICVGTGAAYGRPAERQSCHLVRFGEVGVCLDLGSGTFNALRAHVAPENLSAVVVTHLHPDHCVDLLAMRVYLAYSGASRGAIEVHGPPGLRERMTAFAGDAGWDAAFVHRDIEPGRDVSIGPVRLRFAEVPHLDPTHAVRVEAGGRSLTYGADCRPNDALGALAAGTDLLLAECTFGTGEAVDDVAHLTAADAGRIARAAGAARLLLTHCDPIEDRAAVVTAARDAFGGPTAFARQDAVEPI